MAKKRKPAESATQPVGASAEQTPEIVEPSSMIPANGGSQPPATTQSGLSLKGMGDEDKSYWTTLPRNDPKFPILLMKCLGECDFDSDALLNQTFFVSHLFCHGVELLNQSSGEFMRLPRCVAINPEGKTLKFVSEGAYDGFQWLVRTFGPIAWKPPVPIIIKRYPTRAGYKIIKLELDETKPLPPVYNWQAHK